MRASSKGLLLTGVAGFVLAAAGPAWADPFTYTAAYSYTLPGQPTVSNSSSSTSSPVDLFPGASNGSNTVFGHDYGVGGPGSLTIIGFGSRSSGTGNFSIDGSFQDETSFTNTTGVAAGFTLRFLISAGELNVSVPNFDPAIAGSETASIGEQIKIDNVTRFNYSATLSTTESTQATFSESGAVLNATGAQLGTGFGTYSWNDYFGTIDLGILLPNQTVSITAIATSSAIGSVTTPLQSCNSGGGEEAAAAIHLASADEGGGDECFGDPQAIGRIGDPSSFNGVAALGPIVSITATATPEPASAALFGSGVLGLLALQRRSRRG